MLPTALSLMSSTKTSLSQRKLRLFTVQIYTKEGEGSRASVRFFLQPLNFSLMQIILLFGYKNYSKLRIISWFQPTKPTGFIGDGRTVMLLSRTLDPSAKNIEYINNKKKCFGMK